MKRGQIAIFVILAVVIVAAIVLLIVFRTSLFGSNIPTELRPVFDYYQGCIDVEAQNALNLMASQGGRINSGNFEPGSEYAPFSNQLNFVGLSIPYWHYVSGNGIVKENVPTKVDMENELANYLADRINGCDLGSFYEKGFYITLGDPKITAKINDNSVDLTVNSKVVVKKGDIESSKSDYEVKVNSKIGKFYGTALSIYNKEKKEKFLENYSVDVLRSYAPVDGVEVQCSPKIWKTQEVVDSLKSGLEANLGQLKFKGNYYTLNSKEDNYFVIDLNTDEAVQVLQSSYWPSKIEITPADEELMLADPVGNQEGLGVLGFCYIPYHFVYDLSFPVLIQVNDGTEVFQFPIVVSIDNNLPSGGNSSFVPLSEDTNADFNVCDFKGGQITINSFDNNLNPVEAEIKYQCLDSVCNLGSTELLGASATLNAEIPQCVNGYLIANADGFVQKKELFSSNSESVKEIILDREYDVGVDLKIDGLSSDERAVVSFDNGNNAVSAILPDKSNVKLSEGEYNVSVYVYGSSNIVIPKSTKTQCQDVAKGGLFGVFGATKEECFSIEVPEVKVDNALSAGGKGSVYVLESQLQNGEVSIGVDSFPVPNSLQQLQINYELFNNNGVDVTFT